MAEWQMRDAFNMRVVKILAKNIKKNYAQFEEKKFVSAIQKELDALSLSDRSLLIHANLVKYLPSNYKKALSIILKSIPHFTIKPGVTNWDGFIMLPLCHYVATEGIDEFELSMDALKQMTSHFSSEGAIRYFIKKYEAQSLKLLMDWTQDSNVHVRRLVSEGTRPRLPWAQALPRFKKNPAPILPLLEALKEDEELYVRRSVANNLNDIAKDNPKVVTDVLKRWNTSKNKGTQWIVKHALRSLLKAGNTDALEILGYPPPKVAVSSLTLNTKKLHFGTDLEFTFTLESKQSQNVMIDYIIHYMKANGTLAPKVYKLTKKKLTKGQKETITKKQAFKKITTRVFHAGKHAIEVQINGKRFSYQEFELIKKE